MSEPDDFDIPTELTQSEPAAPKPSFFDKASEVDWKPGDKRPEASDENYATDCANQRCPGQDDGDIVWCMCKEDVLMGLAEGRRREREEQNSARTELGVTYKVAKDALARISEREEQAAREMAEMLLNVAGMSTIEASFLEQAVEDWKAKRQGARG